MVRSKIFWTQVVTILGILLTMFGLELTPEQQASIVTVLGLLDAVITAIFRKWFNHKSIGKTGLVVMILIVPLTLAGCAGKTALERARTYGYETSNIYLNLDKEYREAYEQAEEADRVWLTANVRPLMVKVKKGLITYNDAVLVWSRLDARAKEMGDDPGKYKPDDVDDNQVRLDDLLLDIINLISEFR